MSGIALFSVIAWVIAGLCVLTVVVISFLQKRRTGRWPQIVSRGCDNDSSWFSVFYMVWFIVQLNTPHAFLHRLPLNIVIPAIDLALFVSFAILAAYAFRWAFRSEWHWKTGLWISYMSLFPALSAILVVGDIETNISTPWIWTFVVLLAIFITPQFSRLAYVEYFAKRFGSIANRQPSTDK
ncbi:MAG: hypothetical protein ABFD83_09875 [Armatimonadota bacterium]